MGETVRLVPSRARLHTALRNPPTERDAFVRLAWIHREGRLSGCPSAVDLDKATALRTRHTPLGLGASPKCRSN